MIHLIPFSEAHFTTLLSWTASEEELIQYAGPFQFSFPLTDEQLSAYLESPGRSVFAAINEAGEVMGCGEIIQVSDGLVRLARILISPLQRGRGLGELMVQALLQEAFANPAIQKAELNVYDFNTGAIRCYEKCGFRVEEREIDSGYKDWKVWRMALGRENTL